MKKKEILIGFITGFIMSVTISAAALNSKDLIYTPNVNSWNVNNVQGALDNLYDKSLKGKSDIISALNNKGLNLEENAEYSTIIDGINLLSGDMRRVYLGTVSNNSPSTFDLSSYNGYHNFTNDNFAFGRVSSSGTVSARTGLSGGGTAEGSQTVSYNPTLSYNSTTGILTVSGTGNISSSSGFGWDSIKASGKCSVTVYLFY